MAFFTVLLMFYGLPVHIMRDVYLTASAFFKRLSALLKYRRAIQSMNKYPDATAEDLNREDTCIICREEMRPWEPIPGAVERTRPKKLPCGHILHFGCLRSWLERQQVCPTCRSPVVDGQPTNQSRRPRVAPAAQPQQQQQQNQGQQPNDQQGQVPAPFQRQPIPGGDGGVQDNNQADGGAQNEPQPAAPRHRVFGFGPFRLEIIRQELRNRQDLDAFLDGNIPGGGGPAATEDAAPTPTPTTNVQPSSPTNTILSSSFDNLVNRELASLQTLQNIQHELQTAQLLLAELIRLRHLRASTENLPVPNPTISTPHYTQPNTPSSQVPPPIQHSRTPPPPPAIPPHTFPQYHPPSFPHLASYPYRANSSMMSRYAAPPNTTAIPAGSTELPEGVVLPPGWSLLPLQRMENLPAIPHTATPPPQQQHQQQTEATAGSSSQTYASGSSSAVPSHPGINGSAAPHHQQNDVPRAGVAYPRPQPPAATAAAALAAAAAAAASTVPVSPQPHAEEDDEHQTPVLAPNPVMPNWGGSSQLFANQARLSSNSTPDIPEAEEEEEEEEEEEKEEREEREQEHKESPTTSVPNGDEDLAGSSTNGTADRNGNGKGKSVMVEDGSEEE